MANNYEAEKYYQKINANKNLKLKSSAYYNMGLWNSSGVTNNTVMPDGGSAPVSLQSIYVGDSGYSGHDIMTSAVVNSIIPRALRYALLYHYFGYPVANVSKSDQQTENYKNNQDNKWKTTTTSKYPERIIPRANLAYIMPFNYGGQSQPNFYGTTYLQYCEDYHDGEYEYSHIWEASEGLPSLGSYYDLAKKADKVDDGYYQHFTYAYLRGDRSLGDKHHYCRVDPVGVHYSIGHYLTLGDHRVTNKKYNISEIVEYIPTFIYYNADGTPINSVKLDLPGTAENYYEGGDASDYFIFKRLPEDHPDFDPDGGSVDTASRYPLNTDDGITLGLMYNTSLKSFIGSLNTANLVSNYTNTLKYYEENDEGYLTEYNIDNNTLFPMTSTDFSTILMSPPIASVQFAKSVLKQTSDQLYNNITNPLTKTWAKAFIPSNIFPPQGGDPSAQMNELGFGTIKPASLAALGLGSYGPGQDMEDVMGGFGKSSWYKTYNEPVKDFSIPGTVPLGGELSLYPIAPAGEDPTLMSDFRYSNIASAFKLVPKVANTQEEAQYYLENPNETLNKIVPKVIDYVSYVVSSNISQAKNDSLKGIKRFRFSREIPENLISTEIQSRLIQNHTIGTHADDSDEASPLYGNYNKNYNSSVGEGSSKPAQAEAFSFDAALFGRVIYDDLQDDVLSGKLSYMYRRKPDNFMLIPADTLTLKTMLNAFPSDKDFGPMGDINPIPEIYTNFLKTLSSGFESFADGYTSEGGQKKNIDFWESYFNAANLNAAYGSSQDALGAYTRVYRNIQACKFISDKFLLLKYKSRPKGSSGLLGYYDPSKDFAAGVSADEWNPETLGYMAIGPDGEATDPAYLGQAIDEYKSQIIASLGSEMDDPNAQADYVQSEIDKAFSLGVGGVNETGLQYFKPGQTYINPVDVKSRPYWYGEYFKGWSVEDVSSLKFPVWKYSQQDIQGIQWQPLVQGAEDEIEYSDEISKYPSFKNRVNYGLPDWVKSISVYPSIERSTHTLGLPTTLFPVTDGDNIAQKVASSNLSSEFNKGEVLNNIGTYTSSDDALAGTGIDQFNQLFVSSFYALFPNAYDVDATMLTYKTGDGFEKAAWPWLKIQYRYDPISESGGFNIELRYVVEMEIDETKLISDLVGYGVFNLAGDLDKYVDQGFDPYDLLIKSNGNIVEDTELYEQYDNYVSSLGSGDGSVDFSQFPWYDVAADEEAVDVTEKENQLIDEFGEEFTNAYVYASQGQVTVPLKEFAGSGANNIGYLDNLTFVKITKEWVNGKGEFNKVTVTDPDSTYNGSDGYIDVELLRPSPSYKENKLFFEDKFPSFPLAQTEVQFMSRAATAFIPTWYKLDSPYYHKGDGEYWVNVYLPDDQSCIVDEEDLESKKQQATDLALRQILDFLNKDYTDDDISMLKETYLVARVEDGANNYHIDLRPGDPVQILVKIGAIYVKAFTSKLESLQELKNKSAHIITLDSRFYQQHLTHAVFSLNRIHLDISYSPFTTQGFNAIKEAKRLGYVPIALKKMIALNGYDVTSQGANLINIGFDSNYKLIFISYKEGNGAENLLDIGFQIYKKTEPFNYPNTMSLLYHHRLLKDPTLPWQTVVEQFLVDPKPKIVEKQIGDFSGTAPSNRCSPPQFIYPDWQDILRGLADRLDMALDLDPRFDLGSFQFSLLELFPPCPKPPSGKGLALYQVLSQVGEEKRLFQGHLDITADLKDKDEYVRRDGASFEEYGDIDWGVDFQDEVVAGMKAEIDKTKEYVGDLFSSGEGLKDLKAKIFDLDDLYTYVLNYVDPPTLYAKICKCFLDLTGFESFKAPNFEMGYDNLSAGMNLNPGKAVYAQMSGDPAAKQELKDEVYSGPGGLKEFGQKKTWSDAGKLTIPGRDPGVEIDTEDLFCSFCFNVPSVFMRLPTTNILEVFIAALKALLEFAIAQLLLELITLALEILLSCPEIQCPTGAENLKDYGATNLNDVFRNSGIDAAEALNNCGILQDGVVVNGMDIMSLMDDVSSRLSSVEILGLLDGTPTDKTLKVIQSILKGSYTEIEAQLNNKAKIEDFFTCVGIKVPVPVIDAIEGKLEENFSDPIYCEDLQAKSEAELLNKCGDAFNTEELLKQAQQFDVSKYVEIANVFRETDDLSTQLPPFFSDGGGAQAIMSQMTDKLPTMDYALETTIETAIIPIESTLTQESKDYVKAKKNILVKQDDQRGKFGLIEDILKESKWNLGIKLHTTGTKWRSHSLVNNIGTVFNDLFASSKITYNSGQQEVKMLAGTGQDYDNNYIKFNFDPPKIIDGQRQYTNNYKLHVNYDTPSLSSDTVKAILERSFRSVGIYPDIYQYPKRDQELTIEGSLEDLGPSIVDFIKQFPLESAGPIENKSEQSQTFLNLLMGGIFRGGDNLQDYIEMASVEPNSKNNSSYWLKDFNSSSSEDNSAETIQSIITDKLYWATIMGVVSSFADKLSKNGLLGIYDDNPLNDDELVLAFNLAPILAMTSLIPGYGVIVWKTLTKNLYRREIERLDLTPTQPMGGVGGQSLIDYDKIKQIIKKNYDISKYYDPNSMELGPMHLALLEGWVSAMCQMFAGEVFLKGIFTLSMIPKEILTADKMIVDFIFEDMEYWLDLPRNSSFKSKFINSVNTIVSNKPEWEFSSETNSSVGAPGKLFDINSGKEIQINDWRDATKYFIRNNIDSPLSFVQQRVQALKPVGNPAPELFNPVQTLTHGTVIEILEGFGGTKTLNLPYGSANSLCTAERINEFKNGKFFFQYYFKLTELQTGSEKYNALIDKLNDLDIKLEASGEPGSAGYLSVQEYVEYFESNESMSDLVVKIVNNFRTSRPTVDRGQVTRDSMIRIAKGFYNPPSYAVALPVIEAYAAENWGEEDVEQTPEEVLDNVQLEAFGGADILFHPSSIEDIKKFVKFEDLFEKIELGVRLCYGFTDTDMTYFGNRLIPVSTDPVLNTLSDVEVDAFDDLVEAFDDPAFEKPIQQEEDQVQAKTFRDLAEVINDVIGSPQTEDDFWSSSLGVKSKIYKCWRIRENAFSKSGTDDEFKNIPLDNYIFPIIQTNKKVTGEDVEPQFAEINEWVSQNLGTLTDPEFEEYEEYDDFMLYLPLKTSFKNALKDMTSEMTLSPAYGALFRYSIPISKVLYLLCLYNVMEVSSDIPCNVAFEQTKTVLKETIETIYETRGTEAYKHQPSYIKQRGGPVGLAASANKITGG